MQARGREETANEAAPLRRRCLRRSWLLTQDEETSDVRAFPALAWDRGQRDVINAPAASTNALRALSKSRDATRREVVRANEVRGRVYRRNMPIERVLSVKRLQAIHFFWPMARGASQHSARRPFRCSIAHAKRSRRATHEPFYVRTSPRYVAWPTLRAPPTASPRAPAPCASRATRREPGPARRDGSFHRVSRHDPNAA